jgi:hypothetical protein
MYEKKNVFLSSTHTLLLLLYSQTNEIASKHGELGSKEADRHQEDSVEPLNAHTDSSNPTASHVTYGLRVYTFGTFGIEWVDPQTGQVTSFPPDRLQGGRVASSWALFKA